MVNPLEGLNIYKLGPVSVVFRNLNITNPKAFPRRYIRLIINIFGYVLTIELRFKNSI